jgi:2-methylcitrate dehydratase PrpD
LDAMEELLDFGLGLAPDDLPPRVRERARVAVLDTLAATLAGSRAEGVREIAGLVGDWGGAPQATVLATGTRAPAPAAALANGTQARALDLDDVHEQNTCHVSASVVPAALAVAEQRRPVSGADFLAAVAAGAELVCRLSAAPRVSFSQTGMSLTYQCGFFGAALAAARLARLRPDAARDAMGIAYARVAGNQQGFLAGAMTVRLMQGIAAEAGVMSALLAERGITGARDVLEGRFGYYHVFHRGRYERADLVDGLGARWLLEDVSIKPVYPCCKFIHGPIAAMLEVRSRTGIAPEDIAEARFTVTNEEVFDLVCAPAERKWAPRTVTDAQFSLPFMTAWAAVHGGIGFRPLRDGSLQDPRVRGLLPRIHADRDIAGQGAGRGTFPMPGVLAVTDRSGRRHTARVDHVKGHPANPMSFDEVAAKLRECAAHGAPGWPGAELLVDAVRHLEDCRDVSAIADLVASAGQAR